MVEPNPEQRRRIILWEEIVHLADHLAHFIGKQEKVDSIYGIPRGGMPLAVILSHRLKLPIVDRTGIHATTLIVDDIADSGKTLIDFIQGFRSKFIIYPTIVTFFKRYTSKAIPEFIGEEIHNDDWLIFPWEM